MSVELDKVRALMAADSYMELEEAGAYTLTYATRENGDVGECSVGRADVAHARAMRTAIVTAVPSAVVELDTCDEWVNLTVRVPKN